MSIQRGAMSHPSLSVEPKVFDESTSEDAALEQLGYQQELKRSFGLIGMIGFSFSIVTCWTALSGVFIIGVESGGPPVIVWSWLGVCIVTLAVAYSMAEMCSAYPVAGGQYSWVALLAPKRWARGMSYICGWYVQFWYNESHKIRSTILPKTLLNQMSALQCY